MFLLLLLDFFLHWWWISLTARVWINKPWVTSTSRSPQCEIHPERRPPRDEPGVDDITASPCLIRSTCRRPPVSRQPISIQGNTSHMSCSGKERRGEESRREVEAVEQKRVFRGMKTSVGLFSPSLKPQIQTGEEEISHTGCFVSCRILYVK